MIKIASLGQYFEGEDFGATVRIASTVLALLLLTVGLIQQYVFGTPREIAGVFHLAAAALAAWPLLLLGLRGWLAPEPCNITEQLVSLAILAALASENYLTAVLVPVFMSIGHFLEERGAMGAREAIDGLKQFHPQYAWKVTAGGKEKVSLARLTAGTKILVHPGEIIPADGRVTTGYSAVNQATITGESLPVDIAPGSAVYAGTANMNGTIEVTVETTGNDTALGKVMALLQEAIGVQTPVTRLLERFSRYYLPLIVLLSLLTFFLTRDLTRAVTVLIVACPCALVLSSPAAMIAALAIASRWGILIKNTRLFEAAGGANCLVLDKTGTVTLGELQLIELCPEPGYSGRELLSAAYAVAHGSLHPVARAVTRAAADEKLAPQPFEELEEIPGRGMRGRSPGCTILFGQKEWVDRELGRTAGSPEQEQTGQLATWVARDGKPLGCLKFADRVRSDAKQALEKLRAMGLQRIVLVTGDRAGIAEQIGNDLGVDRIFAECVPEQKFTVVKEEQAAGYRVIAVGDGINDALALAAAEVGVAMGAMGSTVALQSADIALLNNRLDRIPAIITLSRTTCRVVIENVGLGITLSLVMMALAGTGMIGPVAGAVFHNLGAIAVLLNSARLLRSRPVK